MAQQTKVIGYYRIKKVNKDFILAEAKRRGFKKVSSYMDSLIDALQKARKQKKAVSVE